MGERTKEPAIGGEIQTMRSEALALLDDGLYRYESDDSKKRQHLARRRARLALALDDLDMAREIDLAEYRAGASFDIVCRRGICVRPGRWSSWPRG